MSEKVKFGRSKVFFDPFERRPGPIKKNMHYCPGCGHGILHKLIAEAIEEYGIQGKTVIIAPVGCAVFAYYYFNVGSISVPHGRAPAVATGASRANPDSFVISYQGDGDLAAIGFNEFIQAANRGEKISVFFVNNSNYGMTGGQMAPTTLPGQITTTSPYGRNPETDGFPTKVCEIVNALEAPVYIERVALTSTANILKAKKAVNKAIENLRDRKGFSLVEVLSPCPINLKMSADQVNDFIDEKMTKFFPLGCVRDRSAATPVGEQPPAVIRAPEEVKSLLLPGVSENSNAADASKFAVFQKERRVKICGFGGQGVLSLGLNLANMGRLSKLNVSWMPSYGPEQRGGAASCAVIVNSGAISSPMVDRDCDLLIAMTQTGLDKFRHVLGENGILVYDHSTMAKPAVGPHQKVYGLDALAIANSVGNPKCANSAIIGALSVILRNNGFSESEEKAFDAAYQDAITENFAAKPAVLKQNLEAFAAGKKAALE
ncbi:MAG: 2-oxoacid:acceptor oxidoreductase family protein [Victivallaceae bacterium]|nr:2-oxoacid:acceptor oxidoreductase family protein [Victivallaceae bacterium]